MAAWLKQLLVAPRYPEDPELSVQSRLFNFAALAILVGLSFALANNLLVGRGDMPVAIPASMVVVGVLLAGARRGHLRLSSALLPVVFLLMSTAELLARDGVHDSAVATISGVLALAAALMKWRALAAFTLATVTIFYAVGYGEIAGFLPNRLSAFTHWRYLSGVCISFVLIAAGVRVLMDSVVASLREAHDKGAEAGHAQDRLDRATQASKASLWEWDIRRGTTYLDKGWASLLGSEPKECYMTVPELESMVHPDDLQDARRVQAECIKGRTAEYALEFRVKSHSADWIWVMNRGKVVERDGAGRALRLAGIVLDVTDRKRAEARIQQLATRDALTGLPNRLLLNDRLALSMSQARRDDSFLALFFIGLDRFKYINDSLGHAIGDAFLKAVAERLSGVVRPGDTLARLGGDEFVVLLENVRALEDEAGQVARKILNSFTEPFSIQGHTLSCSCSIGISVFPSDAADSQTLVHDADTAMHHVKESGRGSYRYFSSEMNERMQERLQLENGLRDAIAGRQFALMYQPKVDVAGGQITGLEALLRWHHPRWGVVSPARFISVAEDTGLIVDIGRWVLEEVCRQLCDWRGRGLPLHPVAVNLSVRQFTPALIGEISNLLKKFDVDPDLIDVEITESLFLKNSEDIGTTLKGLARIGTRVMIDDFGTGYSSLSYIKHFAVNGLKIDRSFVSDLATSPQGVAIVRAIITMAGGLGIRVIAEGVETHDQLEILRKHRCIEYQGFLFSVPLVADQIERRYLRLAGAPHPAPANRIA